MSRYLGTVADLHDSTSELVGANVTIDVETTGLHWWNDNLIGLGVSCSERCVDLYVPVETEEDASAVSEWVRRLPARRIIGQNLKFDLHFLALAPSELKAGGYDDTLIMAHLLDSRQRKSLGMLEEKYLGSASKRNHLEHAGGKMIWTWPVAAIADYCVNDCIVTRQLWEIFDRHIDAEDLRDLYIKEMAYLDLIWRAERKGVLIDREAIGRAYKVISSWQNDAVGDLAKQFWARDEINNVPSTWEEKHWRSPKRLSEALYERWPWEKPINPFADADGVDRSKFALGGQYNKYRTSTFIIMEKAKHPVAENIAWIRELERLKQVSETWLEMADEEDRIHTSFNQSTVRTGRLSSSGPALQNVPGEIRARTYTHQYSDFGSLRTGELNLRRSLIAPKGYKIVSIDYKQQEMRLFAVLSQEKAMLELCKQRSDIHRQVAGLVWGETDEVHREWAKAIGFGLVYGMNVNSMTHRLNRSPKEARAIAEQYWSMFPRILPWLNEVIQWCKRENLVRYWSGRIWREDDPRFFYRAANALIQGGAADLLSVAAIRCDRYLRRVGAGSLISFIHDEMLFEVHEEAISEVMPRLLQIAEVEDLFDVPFLTDGKIGPSYGELKGVS